MTLGGGLAMLPPIQEEFVEKRKWLSDEEMVDTVAAMQSMPGIIASKMAILLGFKMAGWAGGVAAFLGSILPPFIAIVALAKVVYSLRQYEIISNMFMGVRSAVVAMILMTVISTGRKILSNPDVRERAIACGIAGAGFVAMVFFGVNAISVLVTGAVLGWLLFFLCRPKAKEASK
ncbi:MAG: chromate transporter [Lentisphaeria bacterium]|nr:chromate transporter [Lentisphaeria bacterium]